MRVNYAKNTYCRHCEEIKPLGWIRCDVCSFRLRYKKHNSSTWYKRHRDELLKLCHRRDHHGHETFPTQMRKIRVKRIISGLKANIPVPEVE